MINLYKDIKYKYYATDILGILIILMITILIIIKTSNLLFLILFIILSILFAIMARRFFLGRTVKRLKILSNKASSNVGVRDSIKEYEELLKNAKTPSLKTMFLNNIAGAYVNLGELNEAMKLYGKEPPVFDDSSLGIQNHIIYVYNICEISIRTGVYFHARSNMALMRMIIDSANLTEDEKKEMDKIYNDIVIWLVFAEDEIKDYESIKKYYLKRYNEETLISGKVFFAYQLSKVYKKLKKKKESKEYLDFYNENKEELNYEW